MRFLRRRFDTLPRTDPDSSFLPPSLSYSLLHFIFLFFAKSLPFMLPFYFLHPFSLLQHFVFVPFLSLLHILYLFPTTSFHPFFCQIYSCVFMQALSFLPCFLASVSFFLTSFSRYLPPSFPFNLFLKVFYFLSKLLFPSLYLSFFPYHLSFHSLFSTLFPLSFFDSLTVSFPLYSLISFFVTFIHFLPPSFLFPCLAYLPSSPCFLFPSLLS